VRNLALSEDLVQPDAFCQRSGSHHFRNRKDEWNSFTRRYRGTTFTMPIQERGSDLDAVRSQDFLD
jgi:hypothetical protein